MLKFSIIIIFSILQISSAVTQTKIASIDITGNDFLSASGILNLMVSKKEGNFKEDQFLIDLKTIRDKYKTSGFLYMKFEEENVKFNDDSSFADISLKINEGNQVEIGKIEIEGNLVVSDEEILKLFRTKISDNLNDNTLNNDILELLKLYESRELPFAKVRVKDVSVYKEGNTEKLKIELSVEENSRVQIEEVLIKGNETTKDYVIIRELKLDQNKTVTAKSLQDMKQRLDRLNIFEYIAEPKIYSVKKNEKSGLLIEVKEGNTNTFDGVIGYNPPNGTETSGYLTGLINVSFRNLFGTGRKIQARYMQEVKETQEIELAYLEPYFLQLPFNINFGFLQRIQDTAYTSRNLDFKGDLLYNDNFTISLLAGYNRVIPSDIINPSYYVADSQILFTGLELKYDSRDNIYIPEKGILGRTNYSYVNKTIYNSDEVQGLFYDDSYAIQRYYIELDFYSSFASRQSLLLRIMGGEVNSDVLDETDYFRIGGIKYIRGYRYEQYLASRLAASNIELRYSISRKGFLLGFYDFGYYFRPEDSVNNFPEQSGFLYGYGLGIRIESGIGIIGVSYALGKDAGLLDGILNFGLVNDF
ncbi:MAG TPA: POTRA domain-containing protein [Ignavibacteria bacterium]|nr:POTRA domain-containing protein [Ignavibacteria bacterium]